MGKFMLGVIVGALLLFGLYRHQPAAVPVADAAVEREDSPQIEFATTATTSAPARRCDGRQYCSQMSSCEEATWFLQNCPGMKMDGDRDGRGDGVPCEKQWCGQR